MTAATIIRIALTAADPSASNIPADAAEESWIPKDPTMIRSTALMTLVRCSPGGFLAGANVWFVLID